VDDSPLPRADRRQRRRWGGADVGGVEGPSGRGLHSFCFQLNISAFCGIGGVFRDCLGVMMRVFRRCRGMLRGVKGVFRVRYGSG